MAQRQFSSTDTLTWNERYGDGSDGTISYNGTFGASNTTCTGTSGSTSLSIGSALSFSNGNIVLIHQTRGTGAGNWELNKISSGGGTTSLTMAYALTNTYSTGAQIVHLGQYSTVNVVNGNTLTAPAWNGSTGGIIAFLCNGTTTIDGTITLTSKGFRAGTGRNDGGQAQAGEGTSGAQVNQQSANGNGGGGGVGGGNGGGGGNKVSGSSGSGASGQGAGGSAVSTASLVTMNLGGGGGGGSHNINTNGAGGVGGGILLIISKNITVTGSISNRGTDGVSGSGSDFRSGGGGAGGSILIKGQSITLGSSIVNASKGLGPISSNGKGGDGADGQIHIDYSGSLTGTTSPTVDSTLDFLLADPSPVVVKANIKVTTSNSNSVVSNLLATYSQPNSVKANMIKYRGLMDNYTIANFTRSHYEKKYDYRIYNNQGVYLTTWSAEVITEPSFRTVINGGPGELVVRLKRNFDDFGEGEDISLYNRVELWCADRDMHNGILLYSGFISGYRPVLDGQSEYVEVTILHDITEFSQIIFRASDGSTVVQELTKDPSQIFRDILDRYQADGGRIMYTASSIDNTNTSTSYDFTTYSVKEAVDKTIELSPDDWYWRIDPDNTFHLHISNFAAADHIFYIGKHINFMETWRRGEDIVNKVYFIGGGDPSMFRVYQNSGSISSYGIHATKYVDERVTVTTTADYIASRIINEKKDPEIRTTLRIIDNNGLDAAKGYDIESIKVGQTLRIFGLKSSSQTPSLWDVFTWDTDVWDQTITAAASDILQIQSVSYTPNSVEIEASSRIPIIAKRIEDVNRNLVESQTDNTPSSPTTGP